MYNTTNTRDYGIPNAFVNNAGFALNGNTDGGNRRIVMGSALHLLRRCAKLKCSGPASP